MAANMGMKRATRRRTPASAPCPQCGRIFARNDSLIRHLKTHSSNADQRPYHRIINDKFRACNHCRRSKIRCTGAQPCARCEQLGRECRYDHQKPDSDAGSEPPTTPPMIQPEQTPGSPGLPREASSPAIASDEHEPKVPTTSILSSPKNARIILHPSDLTVHDHNPSVFTLTKDFIVPESTYVSPTFHVLDPYSYRLPSIADSREPPTPSTQPLAHCKYVVLQALAPFLDADFGSGLACDLLDTYFSSAYSTRMHPTCHHIHNFILRKDDILDPVRPRKTHPALLASMLFVASLSDKALGLFSGPEERDRVCKYLSLTTYRLLNPARYESLLSQEDLGLPPTYGSTAGWTNEDIRRALEPHQEPESFTLSGMDYVIALIHVSSVISGSEKKAASIRW